MTLLASVLFWLVLAVVVTVLAWLLVVLVMSAGLWTLLKVSPLTVLLAGPMVQPFSDTWSFAGVYVDSLDIVLATLALTLVLRRRRVPHAPIPHLGLWVVLGIVTSIAYVCAPANRDYVTDPIRLGYQLYRYCWKPILYYPLTALLVTDRKAFERVLLVAVLVADIFAIQATIDGYVGGIRAAGPFGYGSNALGSALVLPLIIAMAQFGAAAEHRWFYGGSALLILRAVMFTGSRGAAMGALCGGALLIWGLYRTSSGRRRLASLVQALLAVVIVVAALRGNPLERPTLQRFIDSGGNVNTETLHWRVHERWPHFLNTVLQNPWVGVGTDTDLVFGEIGNTPHNGYLSIAVSSGVPALVAFLLLVGLAVRSGCRAFRRSPRSWQGGAGLAASAAVVSVLVHNLVDTTITVAFVAQMFWMLAAIAARMDREAARVTVAVAPARPTPARPVVLRHAGHA